MASKSDRGHAFSARASTPDPCQWKGYGGDLNIVPKLPNYRIEKGTSYVPKLLDLSESVTAALVTDDGEREGGAGSSGMQLPTTR